MARSDIAVEGLEVGSACLVFEERDQVGISCGRARGKNVAD